MIMHDWNTENPEAILLIHPMLASAALVRSCLTDYLGDCHRYLVPDLSAHGAAGNETYRSAADEAKAIHSYLISEDVTHLKLAYGASLGGVVLLELLEYKDLDIDHLFFEGMSFFTDATFMYRIFRLAFLFAHRNAVKNPALAMKKMTSLYGAECAEEMTNNLIRMKKESIVNIVHDCGFVDLPRLEEKTQKKCTFTYGEKDFDYKKAMKIIPKVYPFAGTMVWPGYGHCEKLIKEPEVYADILKQDMCR